MNSQVSSGGQQSLPPGSGRLLLRGLWFADECDRHISYPPVPDDERVGSERVFVGGCIAVPQEENDRPVSRELSRREPRSRLRELLDEGSQQGSDVVLAPDRRLLGNDDD